MFNPFIYQFGMHTIQVVYDEGVGPLPSDVENLLKKQTEGVLNYLADSKGSVSILFCDEGRIREFNRTFRQEDKSTDILSWLCLGADISNGMPEDIPWGELAICLDICRKQAESSGWELVTELQRLIVHGIAHLLGYDHETAAEEKIMLRIESDLLSRIGLCNIY